jgi:hypothetical protein
MPISFPAVEASDGSRDVVSFPADALQDRFGGSNIPPLDTFRANRGAIERNAERIITHQRFEPDGSILIRSRDC